MCKKYGAQRRAYTHTIKYIMICSVHRTKSPLIVFLFIIIIHILSLYFYAVVATGFLGSSLILNPSALFKIMSACSLKSDSLTSDFMRKFLKIVDKTILSLSIAYFRPTHDRGPAENGTNA